MPIQPLSKAALLELWRRVNPPSYTVPIEDQLDGQGFDIPSAQAAIFSAADSGVNECFQAHYLREHPSQTGAPAAGAARARTTVQVTRLGFAGDDLIIPRGTRLIARQTGSLGQEIKLVDFEAISDTTMTGPGPHALQVQATVPGYTGNVAAYSIVGFKELGRATVFAEADGNTIGPTSSSYPNDRFTSAMAGRYVLFTEFVGSEDPLLAGQYPQLPFRRITSVNVQDQTLTFAGDPILGQPTGLVQVLEFNDLGLVVTQPQAATGGRIAMLDGIGADRGAGRVLGESDEQYRLRLGELGDTITPNAISAVAGRVLTPCGVPYRIHETRETQQLKGFVLDADPLDFGQVPPVPRLSGADIYGEGAVLLGRGDARSFFLLRIGYGNEGEFGAPYDAANASPANAWDWLFLDGSPLGYHSCIGQLFEALDTARAAGVNFSVLRDKSLLYEVPLIADGRMVSDGFGDADVI